MLAGEQATNKALNKQVTDLESREKIAVTEARDLKKQLTDRTDYLQQVESQPAQAVGEARHAGFDSGGDNFLQCRKLTGPQVSGTFVDPAISRYSSRAHVFLASLIPVDFGMRTAVQ
jgi:hypothetical protein